MLIIWVISPTSTKTHAGGTRPPLIKQHLSQQFPVLSRRGDPIDHELKPTLYCLQVPSCRGLLVSPGWGLASPICSQDLAIISCSYLSCWYCCWHDDFSLRSEGRRLQVTIAPRTLNHHLLPYIRGCSLLTPCPYAHFPCNLRKHLASCCLPCSCFAVASIPSL